MSKDQLLFCPLGGSGEIGMNLNLYAYGKQDDEKWIVVDMGVTFADDSIPGIDLIYPDPGFLIEKKKKPSRHCAHPRPRRSHRFSSYYMATT